VALSLAAAACAASAGGRRRAALLVGEVAGLLCARGSTAAAVAALGAQLSLCVKEGWLRLAGALLPGALDLCRAACPVRLRRARAALRQSN